MSGYSVLNAPFVFIAGAPGLGKSASAFEIFQDSYTILSSRNNIHYYAKRLRTKKLDPDWYRLPRRIKLIDTADTAITPKETPYVGTDALVYKKPTVKGQNGEDIVLSRVDAMFELSGTLSALAKATRDAVDKKEPPPYPNVIIDEMGELLDRCFSQMIPMYKTDDGKPNTREAFKMANEWIINEVADPLRQLVNKGVGVGCVFHDRGPEDATPKSKAKQGGIKAVSATIARKLTTMADICVQRYVVDPKPGEVNEDGTPKRRELFWDGEAQEKWDLKVRGMDPEDAHLIATSSLTDIITVLGDFQLWTPEWRRGKTGPSFAR